MLKCWNSAEIMYQNVKQNNVISITDDIFARMNILIVEFG